MKLGLTLPSFRADSEAAIAVARAADSAGVDGVFVFDHMFGRDRDGHRRPALEGLALLGAVAAETSRVVVGTLVARATLLPPASLATALETLLRIAPGRFVAGIGAGDSESREENESYGLPFGSMADRVVALGDTVRAARERGFPVWVGGTSSAVREVAARDADGWNQWGGTLEGFAKRSAEVRAAAVHAPFTPSWGGLVVMGPTEGEARAKRERLGPGPEVISGGPEHVAESLRRYGDAGAEWVIAGPVDSSDPENAHILGELVAPLLRQVAPG